MTDLFVIGTEETAFTFDVVRVGEIALPADETWENVEWARQVDPLDEEAQYLKTQDVTIYRLVPVGKIEDVTREDLS